CSKHIKELKYEIDHILAKREVEHLGKEIAESIDPGEIFVDPPPDVTAVLAQAVDNLGRQVAALRPFIGEAERPPVALSSPAAINAVPIHPIAPALLASQTRMPMEGMEGMEGLHAHRG